MGVILLFLFLGRRQRQFNPIVTSASPEFGRADWQQLAHVRPDERRRALRRGGLPTSVHVFDPKSGRRSKPLQAFVLDRSAGGIRIAIEKPLSVGQMLQTRPTNAPDEFTWVTVIVRNCREVGDYFEVGCQFEAEPELGRLLMFG